MHISAQSAVCSGLCWRRGNTIDPVIGIDFGMTRLSVSPVENGAAKALPNSLGRRYTHAIIHFNRTRAITGSPAKPYVGTAPCHAVYSAKRLLGTVFFSSDRRDHRESVLYSLIFTEDARAAICLPLPREATQCPAPEEIVALRFYDMRSIAESYLH
jgi:molecular chaperone DnaK (HSP70)